MNVEELKQRDEELKYTQEQSVSQKTGLQQQIFERDAEIEKLRNQVSNGSFFVSTLNVTRTSMQLKI